MSEQNSLPSKPIQHAPGAEGSTYVSPNTKKGTPKKNTAAVEEAAKKDEVTPGGEA